MAQVRRFFTVLMIPSLVGLPSVGAVAYTKSVCAGHSVQLFDGIQINDSNSFATLHKNGDKHIDLGRWTISSHTFYENKNLMMDDNKNVWIINVHPVDEGLYHIKYTMANGPPLDTTVQLNVWVAPNDNCNISVSEKGQILTVSLTGKDCGKPKASVYWKKYTGATVHDEKALQLQSGREAGTYFACMRGVSLSCANSSDPSVHFCRSYTVNKGQSQSSTVGSTIQLSSDGSTDPIQIADFVLQCVVLVLVLVISFRIYIVYKKDPCGCKGKSPNAGHEGKKGEEEAARGQDKPENRSDVPNADRIPEEIPLNAGDDEKEQSSKD